MYSIQGRQKEKTRSRSLSLNPIHVLLTSEQCSLFLFFFFFCMVGRGFYKLENYFFVPEWVPKSSTDQTDFNVSTSTTKTCITGK